MAETRTLCPYCGVGCGLLVDHEDGRVAGVRGDPLHPTNRGRTCRKPLELPSAVHAPDRATTPLVRADRAGRFAPATWDDALGGLARRLAGYRPGEIAFYISGQLLTEDYYAVNKLAKGFLGTNNVDSNSRLCMSSAVAGYSGAFGFDGPPPAYADLDLADCLLLLGTNTAACHPIAWSRIRDRQASGGYVIVADPRPTPTARAADLHLPVRPGTDLALLNAMLHVIDAEGLTDAAFVEAATSGFAEAIAVAREWTPERAAAVCGVDAEAIVTAATRFAGAGAAMALWSMGANQSAVGTLKNRALINLCLAAGQIGRPGSGPLSLTGQPNAMGGRETGGLAHLLPGYRRVDDPADRAAMEAHWGCPPIAPEPGLAAVELFDALAEGRVKAVWIVATNPLVSLPDGDRARAALERAELVVVQDAFHPTETSALAHVALPAAAWPEKTGTMTSSERRVGLVERAIDPPGAARPDWEIFAGLGRALGHHDAFAWPDAAAVFDEFAACTAGRPCDVSGLSHERLRTEGSRQWPCPAGSEGTRRLYADRRFPTPDRRARFAPTPHAGPAEAPDADHPLLLTSGRVAEHWHTLTRTGKSPALRAAAPEPFVELHPDDAPGVRDGDLVRVASRRGAVRLRARLVPELPRGTAFAPFHWGALHAPAGAGQLNAVTHGTVDPTSRQPELKAVAVRVERVAGPVRRTTRPRRLVVVGTGMAGQAVVEEAMRRRDGWRITMLGEEPGPAYNRVLVSKLLAGTCGPGDLVIRPAAWFAEHGIDLRGGCPATSIDLRARAVTDAGGERHAYDALVIATGSRPLLPPIPGIDAPHVLAFRTPRDVDALHAARPRRAVVIGGGLLGLEAAAGLHARGARVTVIDVADRLMPRQLDAAAGALLRRQVERLGLAVELAVAPVAVGRDGVLLDDGRHLPADLVVCAAGVRPETTLARAAGLEVARGIVVDDQMRTSAPGVYAVGECAEHRGVVHGLWAPLAAQARVAGAGVAGDPAAFTGAVPATVLKVAGVDVRPDHAGLRRGPPALRPGAPLGAADHRGGRRHPVHPAGRVVRRARRRHAPGPLGHRARRGRAHAHARRRRGAGLRHARPGDRLAAADAAAAGHRPGGGAPVPRSRGLPGHPHGRAGRHARGRDRRRAARPGGGAGRRRAGLPGDRRAPHGPPHGAPARRRRRGAAAAGAGRARDRRHARAPDRGDRGPRRPRPQAALRRRRGAGRRPRRRLDRHPRRDLARPGGRAGGRARRRRRRHAGHQRARRLRGRRVRAAPRRGLRARGADPRAGAGRRERDARPRRARHRLHRLGAQREAEGRRPRPRRRRRRHRRVGGGRHRRRAGVYRKLVVSGGRVAGTILLGDARGSAALIAAVRSGEPVDDPLAALQAASKVSAADLPAEAQVCDCNGVCKGAIEAAVLEDGCATPREVMALTRAGTGCGSCKPTVIEIVADAAGGLSDEPAYLCPCRRLTREDVAHRVREDGLRSVSEVAAACGAGRDCGACKPALAYLVSEINANRHREERDARFINDRVHANIQNDGTFSVVPRMYGGVTTPDELRRIADVAERYGARMVKVTGGQRIDLLGIRKQDLPAVWRDLDMPSGHAYAKAVRTVKTCVGSEFCRFGVGDSIALGIAIERAWEGLYTPAKVKGGVSGCRRNCAEATVKDIGVLALDGGRWEIRIGGAAGASVREADVLCQVDSPEEVIQVSTAALQLYREEAEYKERLYDFVPRYGLERLREAVLDPQRSAALRERFAIAKAAVADPWKERDEPYHPRQFADLDVVGPVGVE